jgi:hypothetical protein
VVRSIVDGYLDLPTKCLPEERYYERRVDVVIRSKSERRVRHGRSSRGFDEENWEGESEPEYSGEPK